MGILEVAELRCVILLEILLHFIFHGQLLPDAEEKIHTYTRRKSQSVLSGLRILLGFLLRPRGSRSGESRSGLPLQDLHNAGPLRLASGARVGGGLRAHRAFLTTSGLMRMGLPQNLHMQSASVQFLVCSWSGTCDPW